MESQGPDVGMRGKILGCSDGGSRIIGCSETSEVSGNQKTKVPIEPGEEAGHGGAPF